MTMRLNCRPLPESCCAQLHSRVPFVYLSVNLRFCIACGFFTLLLRGVGFTGTSSAPDGWTTTAPRDEIAPTFQFDPRGGADQQGNFIIKSEEREGVLGHRTKSRW